MLPFKLKRLLPIVALVHHHVALKTWDGEVEALGMPSDGAPDRGLSSDLHILKNESECLLFLKRSNSAA